MFPCTYPGTVSVQSGENKGKHLASKAAKQSADPTTMMKVYPGHLYYCFIFIAPAVKLNLHCQDTAFYYRNKKLVLGL